MQLLLLDGFLELGLFLRFAFGLEVAELPRFALPAGNALRCS